MHLFYHGFPLPYNDNIFISFQVYIFSPRQMPHWLLVEKMMPYSSLPRPPLLLLLVSFSSLSSHAFPLEMDGHSSSHEGEKLVVFDGRDISIVHFYFKITSCFKVLINTSCSLGRYFSFLYLRLFILGDSCLASFSLWIEKYLAFQLVVGFLWPLLLSFWWLSWRICLLE